MAKKRFTAEQIIHKLREAEMLLAQGLSRPNAVFPDHRMHAEDDRSV